MSRKKFLLDGTKNYYKANMHCHSTFSDGKLTPEELKEAYKAQGYSILAITDHEHINSHEYLDDENFLTITSAEYAIKQFPEQSTLVNFDMKVCHLNLYAKKQDTNTVCYNSVLDHFSKGERREKLAKLEEYERVYGKDGINEIIKIANENGFFVCYNHPRWSLENYGDYAGYEGLWGVEIYNNSVNEGGIYDYDINVVDDFLRDGKRVFVCAGDDNHNAGKSTHKSFGAFVMVNAEKLEYDTIIDALLKGNSYASTGPLIDELYVEDNKVHIKCSKAKRITYSTHGRRSACLRPNGEDGYITEGEFEIRDKDIYFRIDVIDEYGKRANTQAYYINEL